MTLGQLAKTNPSAKVRLVFRNEAGTGTLETTAEHAAEPNRSMRFFPPDGETPVTLNWSQPWWYAEEIEKVYIL